MTGRPASCAKKMFTEYLPCAHPMLVLWIQRLKNPSLPSGNSQYLRGDKLMIKKLQCHVRSLVKKVCASPKAWRILSVTAQVCWTGVAGVGKKDCTADKRGRKRKGLQMWGTVCLKASSLS